MQNDFAFTRSRHAVIVIKQVLLPELNNMNTSNLLFENYTDCHSFFTDYFSTLFTRISSTTKSSFILQITFYCPYFEGQFMAEVSKEEQRVKEIYLLEIG